MTTPTTNWDLVGKRVVTPTPLTTRNPFASLFEDDSSEGSIGGDSIESTGTMGETTTFKELAPELGPDTLQPILLENDFNII